MIEQRRERQIDLSTRGREWCGPAAEAHRRAALEDLLGGPFAEEPAAAVPLEDDRGAAALERERQRRHHGRRGPARPPATFGLEAAPDREVEGVPERDVAVLEVELAAQEPLQVEVVPDRAGGADRLAVADLALGQRAGLVGEQDVGIAEVFDRDEPLDQHRLLRHPPRPGRQAHGHDRRQKLRRQPDRDREREQQRVEDRAAESGVDAEDRDRQHRGDLREQTRKRGQTTLEGSRRLMLLQTPGHTAETGFHAGRDDDPDPPAAPHDRAHEGAVRVHCARRFAQSCDLFLDRIRLAAERRLVDRQLGHAEQAHVGRDHIADLKQADVAGHELGRRELRPRSITQGGRASAGALAQRRERLLAAVLVEEAEPDAERHDPEDDSAGRPLADSDRDRRRDEQQPEQRTPQL